jgi:hypothetical protein
MSFWLQFFLTLVAMAITDAFWTLYMLEVAAKRALRAGFWSAAIIALTGLTIVSYIDDWRMLIAAVIGAFLGTYITVTQHKKSS